MKKIALVLSGCGFRDGAEITEAVSCLIALSELGAKVSCFSPDKVFPSSNHITGEDQPERNALIEASRITRGQILPMIELKERDFEGVVFPGGFGVARNLSNWATQGASCEVDSLAERTLNEFHRASKPIAAFCIAPALVSRVLGEHNPTVTIGNDQATATEIEKTGASHEECPVDDYITDRMNKIVTAPAYMYDGAHPHLVYKGIQGALREFYEMA